MGGRMKYVGLIGVGLFLIFAQPLISFAQSFHREAHHVPNARSAVRSVGNATRIIQSGTLSGQADCEADRTRTLNHYLGSYQGNWSATWRATSCDDLFSSSAPAWIRQFTGENASFLSQHWWPMCTLAYFDNAREPSLHYTSDAVLHYVAQEQRYGDLCTPQENRYFHPGEQFVNSYEVTDQPLNTSQRQGLLREAVALRKSAAASCCKAVHSSLGVEAQSQCRQLMNGIAFRWCDDNATPRLVIPREQCRTTSAYFQNHFGEGDSDYARISEFQRNRPSLERLPMNSGTLVLSHFNSRGGSFVHPETIAHELGHACSYVQSEVTARYAGQNGQAELGQDAFSHLVGQWRLPGEEYCSLNQENLRFYRHLFERVEAGEAYECAADVVRHLGEQRFQAGRCDVNRGEINNTCLRGSFDEAFADYFRLTISSNLEKARESFLSSCEANRDALHPFTQDLLVCFLRVPSFRSRAELVTGCRR